MSATNPSTRSSSVYRFGPYEVDATRHELRKFGLRVRLERKPLQLLIVLMDRAGGVVSRNDLQHLLWDEGVFVDFDNGLTVALTKLRAGLNDSSGYPRYIETVPGQGYRFIAEVEHLLAAIPESASAMRVANVHQPIALSTELTDQQRTTHGSSAVRALYAEVVSRRAYWFLALPVIVVLALLGFTAHKPAEVHSQMREWVLVSQFDNRTGEPALEDVASFALKLELSDSQSVKVVPAERVQELLRLMKKAPGARIDAVVGREICLRDGTIHLLITGRLEKLGTHYLLSVLLVDPATGVSVRGFSEEASSQAEVLSSVRQLSNRVRERLGEALPLVHRDIQRLEPVTTPSLRALRLYSEAATSAVDGAHAEELLRAAVNEDPQFASAYIDLASALINHGKPREQWLPAAQRALQLADDLPERERYFIRGSYHKMVGDQTEAVSVYETLLSLYPDHTGALSNLYDLTHHKELLYRLAELHPDEFQWNRAAWLKSGAENDNSAEQHFGARAQLLATAAVLESEPMPIEAAALLVGAYGHLHRGELDLARAEAERVANLMDSLGPRGRKSLAAAEGNFYFFLGELRRAEYWYAKTGPECQRFFSAVIAEARGVPFSSFATTWDQDATYCLFDPEIAVKLAAIGHFHMAVKLSKTDTVIFDDYGSLSEGAMELYRGNLKRAVAQLKHANAALFSGPSLEISIVGTRVLAAEALAGALEREGDLKRAAAALQPFETNPHFDPEDALGSSAAARFDLAQLYRRLGRTTDAKKIEAELRALFVGADADYTLARLVQSAGNHQGLRRGEPAAQ